MLKKVILCSVDEKNYKDYKRNELKQYHVRVFSLLGKSEKEEENVYFGDENAQNIVYKYQEINC